MRYYALMIFDFSNYKQYLKAELNTRKSNNEAYSLRSMSLQLGLSPSTLSDVMNNKKNFSERTAMEVGRRLNLSGRKARYFLTLVHFDSTKDENLKQLLASQLRVLNPKMREQFAVRIDQFNVIAEWYHAAILEMTYLDIPLTAEVISENLAITLTQAKEALDLLARLDLIEPLSPDRFKKTKTQITFESEISNQALRRYHHEMLAKAQTSLQMQTNKQKFVGSETLPLNIEDLQEAKDVLENCFQQILQLSERSKKRTHVYHLGIQMFQLTKGLRDEK